MKSTFSFRSFDTFYWFQMSAKQQAEKKFQAVLQKEGFSEDEISKMISMASEDLWLSIASALQFMSVSRNLSNKLWRLLIKPTESSGQKSKLSVSISSFDGGLFHLKIAGKETTDLHLRAPAFKPLKCKCKSSIDAILLSIWVYRYPCVLTFLGLLKYQGQIDINASTWRLKKRRV